MTTLTRYKEPLILYMTPCLPKRKCCFLNTRKRKTTTLILLKVKLVQYRALFQKIKQHMGAARTLLQIHLQRVCAACVERCVNTCCYELTQTRRKSPFNIVETRSNKALQCLLSIQQDFSERCITSEEFDLLLKGLKVDFQDLWAVKSPLMQ